jgi:hypothetical protein
MATIDVYVIDDSSFDLTLFMDSALTWGDVGIKNLKDMVDKLVKLCATGDRIAELRILGHGDPTGQYIGADWVTESSLTAHREQLARMSPLFVRTPGATSRAHVIMAGCRQGQNGSFLLALSNIWNVPVSGFTALQRPAVPGDEGGTTTCYITCAKGARTTADSVDDVQIAITEWFTRSESCGTSQ